MELDFNSADADLSRLKELWHTFKTGAIGVANDAHRLGAFIDEIVADPERRDDLTGAANAAGISLQDVKDAVLAGRRIEAAIVAEFPGAIPAEE